jgi:hypothetical protein
MTGTRTTDKNEIASRFASNSTNEQVVDFHFVKDTREAVDAYISDSIAKEMKDAVNNPEQIRQSMSCQIDMAAMRETGKLAGNEDSELKTKAIDSIEDWRMEAQKRLQKLSASQLIRAKINKISQCYGADKDLEDIEALTNPAATTTKAAGPSPKRFSPRQGMKG